MKKSKLIIVLTLSLGLLTGCNQYSHIHKWSSYFDNGDGTHTRTCLKDVSHIETESHTFKEEQVIIEPTEITPGSSKMVCLKCGYTETVTVPPLGDHVFDREVVDELYLYEKCGDYSSIYYKSCECGAFGDPTHLFEDSLLPTGYSNIEYLQGSGDQFIDTGIENNRNTKIEYNVCKHNHDRLPEDYQEVEYIETTDDQYIDTGFIINKNDNAKLILDYQPSSNNRAFQGANWYLQLSDSYFSDTDRHYIEVTNSGGIEVIYSDGIYLLTNDFTAAEVVDVKIALLHLGDMNNTVYNGPHSKGKLYKAEYYLNDVIKAEYIPCYRKSDGEIGLYDLVKNLFFTNAGSGLFLKGRDVHKHELPSDYTKVDYIESNGRLGAYIDTGIILTEENSVECEFEVSGFEDSEAFIFGSGCEKFGDDAFELYVWSQNIDLNYERQTKFFAPNGKHFKFSSKLNEYSFSGGVNYKGNFEFKKFKPNYSLTLFSIHRSNGVITGNGSTRIYSFKVYQKDGYPILDLVPCYSSKQEEFGMYDLVTETFFANDGNSRFTYNLEINNQKSLRNQNDLDSYSELEYIQSTGTQYINTGISVKPNTKSILDIQLDGVSNTVNGWSELYGYSKDSSGYPYSLWAHKDSDSLYFYNNDKKIQIPLPFEKTTIELQNNAKESSGSIYIFSLGPKTGMYVDALNPYKLFALQIFEGETLVRDFIPVIRNDDNEIGLLDKVNNVFYKNEGSGEFISGPVKPVTTENIYVGYLYNNQVPSYNYGRIYDAKVIDNDEIVRYLIPCLRNADSKVGMFDLITNEFYPTTSSTEFFFKEVVGHHLDDGVISKTATYSEEGEMIYTCSICGEKIHEIIPKLSFKASFTFDEGVESIKIFRNDKDPNTFDVTNVGYTRNLNSYNYSKINAGIYFEIILKDGYEIDDISIKDNKCVVTKYGDMFLLYLFIDDAEINITSKQII